MKHVTLRFIVFGLLISFCFTQAGYAQGFDLVFSVDSDVLAPDDRVVYTLTASNTGQSNLLDLSADILLPPSLDSFIELENFDCPSSTCDPNETAIWTIGTLTAGQSQTLFYHTFIAGNATEGVISSRATVSLPGVSDIIETVDVEIEEAPPVRLHIAPEGGPAAVGESLVYTLTASNISGSSVVDPVLTLPLPEGASFVSASDGGNLQGDVVRWALGALGSGGGRQVQVTFLPDAALVEGTLLVARASLDPNQVDAQAVQSVAVTPVHNEVPLEIVYGMNVSAPGADDRLVYSLTATNTGTNDLLDVTAEVLLPSFIDSFLETAVFMCPSSTCDANEVAEWDIGTLVPGQSQTVFYRTFVAGNAPAGDQLRSHLLAASTSTGQVAAALDLHVDPSPRVRLGVAPAPGPAVAGEPFVYTLTVSNISVSSVVDPVLTLPLPEGTSFVSASDGGAVQNGIVSWTLGPLGSGAGRQVEVTVLPDPALNDGALLATRVSLDPREVDASVVRSIAVTPVREGVPLEIVYGVNLTAPGTDDRLVYSLTATNTGARDLLDVTAEVLLPSFMDSFLETPTFMCPSSTCDANEIAIWDVGTLVPGQSQTVFYRTFVAGNALDGTLLRSHLLATSTGTGQVRAALDLHVDPSPRMRFSIAPGQGMPIPGQPFTYIFTLGNIGTANPGNIQLRMPLPAGTQFSTASDGGSENAGDVVWDLDPLAAGVGQKIELTVSVDESAQAGDLLVARAALDPMEVNTAIMRSIVVTPVGKASPVLIEYEPNQQTYAPADPLMYTLAATNTGIADLLDLTVTVALPQFINSFLEPEGVDCPSSTCDANELAIWSIGTLVPGQRRTQDVLTAVMGTVDRGEILHTQFIAAAAGTEPLHFTRDELIGSLANQAPSAATITSPADSVTVLIGGTTEPGDPAAMVSVQWTAASDPENDPLTYTWQLAETPAFSSLLLSISSEAATPTSLNVDHSTLATMLDGLGVSLGDSRTFYHRVVVSDGARSTPGPAVRIELTRGTLVHTDVETIKPAVFALHTNYPNPFRQTTTISYTLPRETPVRLDLYNALGQHVRMLIEGAQRSGQHVVHIDLLDQADGVYFYRLRAGAFESVKQMVLRR